MSLTVGTEWNEAPISLYFDVSHNEAVDLEVIARASIAWSQLIKELASVVDPTIEVRLDFLSGTIGSRSINSVLRTAGRVALAHPWTSGSLGALAGVFLLAGPSHLASDLTDELARQWFGHEDSALSAQDVERVARRVVELQRDRTAVQLKGEIYDAANRDQRVKGIGASPNIARPPEALIVPRSEFASHQNSVTEPSQGVETRIVLKDNQLVTVVRPYSKAEERRWRFEGAAGEFSATMRDPDFLAAIRSGHTGVEVGEGVQMRLDLRIREELVNGVWQESERDVVRVVSPDIRRQSSFEFTPDKPDEPNE